MLKLNKEIKTKSGEVLTPYIVDGENIYCWNRSGGTVAKKLNDFILSEPVASMVASNINSVIAVTPINKPNRINLQKETITETVISRPATNTVISRPATNTFIKPEIENIVIVSPQENETEKIIYVKKKTLTNYFSDGETQTGGVQVTTHKEPEKEKEFVPVINDNDYI